MSKRSFDPGEIEFVADDPDDFTTEYLKAALKAATDRKRRFGRSTYKVLDAAIDKIEAALEIRRLQSHR